jgi:hypothetical protein
MSLTTVPTELLQHVAMYLTVDEMSSLVLVSRNLHARLLNELHHLALRHETSDNTMLTTGLREVTFWFDKTGNRSVLEWTAAHDRVSTFMQLIALPRADLSQLDRHGVSLLHRLSAQGLVRYIRPLIERFRELNLDPFKPDHSLLTPLHYAAARGMTSGVDLLLALGAVVSAKDHHGNTPLHLAAVNGAIKVVTQLVNAGADVNSRGRFDWTPIDQASIAHQRTVVCELRRLGAFAPSWQRRPNALNEFLRLSPCPLDCYMYHLRFHECKQTDFDSLNEALQ